MLSKLRCDKEGADRRDDNSAWAWRISLLKLSKKNRSGDVMDSIPQVYSSGIDSVDAGKRSNPQMEKMPQSFFPRLASEWFPTLSY